MLSREFMLKGLSLNIAKLKENTQVSKRVRNAWKKTKFMNAQDYGSPYTSTLNSLFDLIPTGT